MESHEDSVHWALVIGSTDFSRIMNASLFPGSLITSPPDRDSGRAVQAWVPVNFLDAAIVAVPLSQSVLPRTAKTQTHTIL